MGTVGQAALIFLQLRSFFLVQLGRVLFFLNFLCAFFERYSSGVLFCFYGGCVLLHNCSLLLLHVVHLFLSLRISSIQFFIQLLDILFTFFLS